MIIKCVKILIMLINSHKFYGQKNEIYLDIEAGSKNPNFIVGAFIVVGIKKAII